jgi:hypothetical protein
MNDTNPPLPLDEFLQLIAEAGLAVSLIVLAMRAGEAFAVEEEDMWKVLKALNEAALLARGRVH